MNIITNHKTKMMKKIIHVLILFFPIMLIGQTQSENYIKNTIYKNPTTTSIPNPTIVQANQSITYYDGLGRPIQKNDSKQSSSGKNIITHFEYDIYGRQVKEYLPYATSQSNGLDYEVNAGSDVLNFPTYVGQNPFTENQVEASPLDRVLKMASQGADWAMGNGHEVKYEYLSNVSSDAVKYYLASSSWSISSELYEISLIQNGSTLYPINSLYKTVVKNENWTSGINNTIELYKNREGKLVLRRSFDNNIPHDIYYVYDQFGNLTYVIPPVVTDAINQMDGLCYQYKHDRYNRLVEKKLPNKNWEFIVYDRLDRVIATGPASSPFNDVTGDGWMINKYDAFNRLIYTGWYASSVNEVTRKSLQALQNTLTTNINETKLTSGSIDGVNVFYSNLVAPTSFKLLTVNYFDNYSYPDAPSSIPTFVLNDNSQAVYFNNTIKPKGLATGTWIRIPETSTSNNFEKGYVLYDKRGRIVRVNNKNYLGGYFQKDFKLDFSGKTLFTETKHKKLNTDSELLVTDVFSYTEQDRLLTHTNSINNSIPQLLFKNDYDEIGQLVIQSVGGTDITGNTAFQKINYSYNIKGWLTGINNIGNLKVGSDPQDLFAYKINYNTVNDENGYTGVALYNGNIAETYWRTSSDNIIRKYGYKYDSLDRLTDAIYQKPGGTMPVPGSYNESLLYDKNGNIMSLRRNGNQDSDTSYIQALEIDNLSYMYNDNSNQLAKVVDATLDSSGFKDDSTDGTIFTDTTDDYDYDSKGNMIKDENKGITSIVYNHNNLPLKIFFGSNGSIEYIYNALGKKVKKKVTDGTTVSTTDYIDGFQYKNDVLVFFPTASGFVNVTYCNTCEVGNQYSFNYVFNYVDHLGNIRMSYTKDPITLTLKVLEENHYYPFGLKHTNYNSDLLMYMRENEQLKIKPGQPGKPLPYKYKYNGKEYQDELGLNMYDYHARNYDPAIGRWMNIDPLAELSRRYSTYTYANDNPIYFIDPDGMWARGSHGEGDPSKEQVDGVDNDDIILGGADAQKAFQELQKSVQGQLDLTMDANGKIDYTNVQGSTPNADTQQLITAIDDHSITVNVDATNNTTTVNGKPFVGGAFGGNTVTQSSTSGGAATVSAFQEINPTVLSVFSNANSKPGVGTLHEVTEAYQGALLSQASGISSPSAEVSGSVYPMAHDLAVKQPGLIDLRGISNNGMIVQPNYINETPYFVIQPAKIQYLSNGTMIMQIP